MSARCHNSSDLLNKSLLVLMLLSSVGMAWGDQKSCSGRCNTFNRTLDCQCNMNCIQKVDCCNDFQDVCEASCENRCFLEYNKSRICQCNAECHRYNNCCSDFNATCHERGDRCISFGERVGKIAKVFNGECLLFTNTIRTWDQSKTFCEELDEGWNMVEKIDLPKQSIIEETIFDKFGRVEFWIGLRRHSSGDGFVWASSNEKMALKDWMEYIAEKEGSERRHGDCYATAGTGSDREGGGWRQWRCTNTFRTICQTNIQNKKKQGGSTRSTTSPSTVTLTSPSVTTPSTSTSPSTVTPSTSTATTRTTPESTKSTDTPGSTPPTSSSSTATSAAVIPIYMLTSSETTMTSANSTEALINPNSTDASQRTTFIIVGVLVGILIIACVLILIIYLRRRKSTINNSENKTLHDISPTLDNVYSVVDTEALSKPIDSQTNNIHYGHLMHNRDGSLSASAPEETYDRANVKEGRQLLQSGDATYDRAIFSQSDTAEEGNVYDHAAVTLITSSELDEKKLLSNYDHAFVRKPDN